MSNELQALHEDLVELKRDLKAAIKILNGNGTLGLVGKVERLEEHVTALEVVNIERSRTWKAIAGQAGLYVVSGAGGGGIVAAALKALEVLCQ